MRLEDIFYKFLNLYCIEKPPMLLALSGGSDSLALFHLLVEERYRFEVAHIDHGWRKESREEASYLAALCQKYAIPFHLKRLVPPKEEKNLEDQAREERLAFFKTLSEKEVLKGVFLGHHADDQAETVLKRVFEGASLPKLRGLLPKMEVEGLTLYRPFLKVKKSVIKQWLETRRIAYFTDPTNADCRFLRSRLREEIIPSLSATFGKEIGLNLCRLGETAAELGDFLEEVITPYRKKIVRNEKGATLDFATVPTPSPFLWKCLIREFCTSCGLSVNHSLLETILFHLQQGSCHKTVVIEGKQVSIHQKKLVLFL